MNDMKPEEEVNTSTTMSKESSAKDTMVDSSSTEGDTKPTAMDIEKLKESNKESSSSNKEKEGNNNNKDSSHDDKDNNNKDSNNGKDKDNITEEKDKQDKGGGEHTNGDDKTTTTKNNNNENTSSTTTTTTTSTATTTTTNKKEEKVSVEEEIDQNTLDEEVKRKKENQSNSHPKDEDLDLGDYDEAEINSKEASFANALITKSSYNINEEADLESKKRAECLGNLERIEKEFSDLKEKFFNDKLNQIKKEMDEIKVGEHQTYQEKMKELQLKREKKIQMAETWKQYQLQNIMNTFDAEKQQFDNEYDEESQSLRDRMVNSLVDKQKRISEEKESLRSDTESRMTTRTRRRQPLSNQQSKVPKKPTPPTIVYVLKENEITDDFNIILKNIR